MISFSMHCRILLLIGCCGWTMLGPGGCHGSGRGFQTDTYPLGSYRLALDFSQAPVPGLTLTHASGPDKVLWETASGSSFVSASVSDVKIEESRGSFTVEAETLCYCNEQSIDSIATEGDAVTLSGRLRGRGCSVGYAMRFEPVSSGQVAFRLELTDAPPEYTCLYLRLASTPDERFFGFGEQFTHLDLKGRKLPVITQEQGIGRGGEPLTSLLNLVAPGSGGDWYTTYAVVPFYITSLGRSLFLENYEVSIFDMEDPNRLEITLLGRQMRGRILRGASPLDLIEEYTAYAGRMSPLPDWVNEGAVVGMQGGTAEVYAKLDQLQAHDTPIAAFWLQDWVGKRITLLASQLWWNWELDRSQYPGWEEMVRTLRAQGIRVMTYINPMLVDVEEKGDFERNLFREAVEHGFFVKDRQGEPYMITNTTFDAGLVDLTHPAARAWYKEVIRDQVLGAGASGWMADYGEALPFDAVLHSGQAAALFHNRYPEAWAGLNREVLREAGVDGDVLFFSRSGYARSPGLSTLFWLGDQLVTFDGHDGMKSAIKGMLSGGLSGYSLNHSDIGGYTSVSAVILNYHRSKELLMRWMEMSAFTAVYRTHEGTQPEKNAQFYTDEETFDHFARFAKVFRALAFYRRELMLDAARLGHPLVRHPLLHYPDDLNVYGLEYQWMLGSDFMVAPVVDEGDGEVNVYLPSGKWVHVWSDRVYGSRTRGGWHAVPAPLGEPAVFYKLGSQAGETFVDNLRAEGLR